MGYIRKTYSVPAKVGMRVIYTGDASGEYRRGTIRGADGSYLRVLLDGEIKPRRFHPTWELLYLT